MKTKLLLLCLVLSLALNAQLPNATLFPMESKENNPYSSAVGKIIGVIDDKVYFSQPMANNGGYIVEKRVIMCDGNTMKGLGKKVILDDKTDLMVDDNSYNVLNGNIACITYNMPAKSDKKGPCSYILKKLTADLNDGGSDIELFTMKRDKPYFLNPVFDNATVSPNKNYLVYGIINPKTAEYRVALVDKDFKLWANEGTYKPGPKEEINGLSVVVNNNGEVVTRIVITNSWGKVGLVNCLTFDNKGTQVADLKVEVKPNYIFDSKLLLTNSGEFILAGVYTKKYDTVDFMTLTDGCFYTKLGKDLSGFGEMKTKELKDDKGKGVLYDLANAFDDDNGGVVFVFESVKYRDANQIILTNWFNTVVIDLNASDDVTTVLPKHIEQSVLCSVGAPYYFLKNGLLHMVFNDSHDNIGKGPDDKLTNSACSDNYNMVLVTCNAKKGTYEKEEITMRKEKGMFNINSPLGVVDGKTVYFNSQVRNGGIGKLVFDK